MTFTDEAIDDVDTGVDERRVGDDGQGCVHQVKHHTQADRKRVLALADEQFARQRATGDVHVVDMLVGIGLVVGNGLVADVVCRLVKGGRAAGGIGDGGPLARYC